MLRYFNKSEFVCDGKNVFQEMDEEFLEMLDVCRKLADVPFQINSSYRTEEYNKKIGGAKNSYHTKGLAVDIKAPDGKTKLAIVKSAIALGLSVGVYQSFVHIDGREEQIIFAGKY